eukprot:7007444-Prymnesium_polylepis.1
MVQFVRLVERTHTSVVGYEMKMINILPCCTGQSPITDIVEAAVTHGIRANSSTRRLLISRSITRPKEARRAAAVEQSMGERLV